MIHCKHCGAPLRVDGRADPNPIVGLAPTLHTVARIVIETENAIGVVRGAIVSDERSSTISRARRIAMLVARRLTRMSYPELGRAFGRDHTSVIRAIQVAGERPQDVAAAEAIEARMRGEARAA